MRNRFPVFSALILALAACARLDHAALAVRPQNTSKGWNADAMHHVDLHQLGNGTWIAAVDGKGTIAK